ncbi:MAG TPA: diguanylate cyclase [Thermodesulfovibrionales bacterium]|nr:diguanylate cyclase [Thermodesulfovibrionales bacterium]
MKTIALISNDGGLNKRITETIGTRYDVVLMDNINRLFEFCFTVPPDLILLSYDVLNMKVAEVILTLKSDPLFGHLPILIATDDVEKLKTLQLRSIIDDYILTPFGIEDVAFRIDLGMSRVQKILETNPLTRLPGNITIIKEIQRRLDTGAIFALSYTDIDYFKPFNDRYGFSRGDEVLRMTARLITNVMKMKAPSESFVGHIGGDDFVFIVPFENLDAVCTDLISNFDEIIQSFYDAEDREKGLIESHDRDGVKRTFPFISLSIGVAHNKYKNFSHYGQVSEIATEMKKYAKRFPGSCYRMDSRRR